ncbi:hypothetical protein OSB04_014681 [Centaurea solstitialis]|uniref:Integrase catalytic domain-containing protein n=1 Tax=Centaurea solstitialis TaxID=347529 RepID=A0AA38TAY7_9ASTR|nr:hypothetical protein OSB04_014681 [Centaurea solstitialis]
MSSDSSLLLNPSMKDLTVVTLPATLKLTTSNYLAWKTQVEALLYGLDLFKFINGSHPAPKPTTAADGSETPHKDYLPWFRQDRLLFGALVGSLNPQIVPLITGAASSHEAWQILAKTYASPSRGHIKQLKHRLKQTTKTPTQSITEYMQQIKTITDELASLGKKMDDEDVIDAILTGLDQSTYKPILDAIHARDTLISFNELHEKLINHELSIAQQITVPSLHQPASVFHLQQSNRGGPGNKQWTQNPSSLVSFHSNTTHDHCNACHVNKSHKLPFFESSLASKAPLDLLFSDVWCSLVTSYDNYKYYIIFVDHYTKYIWLFPLKNKSDSLATFICFQRLVENYFNRKIKQVFSDNGGEYIKLSSHFSSCGISHLTSPPHTPEHNGYPEHRHRHIVETGLALLSHATLPVTFWPFAFTTAAYLINRLPTPTLNNSSPFLSLFNKQPNYHKLRSFGCLCYPWLRPYSPHKLHQRSRPCIFVGYSPTQSAYYAIDPTTYKPFTSRHVVFVENIFPFQQLTSSAISNTIKS